jgi:hypothetical protein
VSGLEVEPAQLRDSLGVAVILDPGLQDALEGDQADERERRQQSETEA